MNNVMKDVIRAVTYVVESTIFAMAILPLLEWALVVVDLSLPFFHRLCIVFFFIFIVLMYLSWVFRRRTFSSRVLDFAERFGGN